MSEPNTTIHPDRAAPLEASEIAPVVLVATADPTLRSALLDTLEGTYRLLCVSDTPSARTALAGFSFDACLVDAGLPPDGGAAWCGAAKADAAAALRPLLVLTDPGDDEARRACIEAGADGFLEKPLRADELCLRLQALLRIRRREQRMAEELQRLQRVTTLKDELTSLILHDLRNPLSGVVGALNLIHARNQDTALASRIDTALYSASRLRETSEELLDVVALDNAQSVLRPEWVSATTLVRESIASVAASGDHRGVRVEFQPAIDLRLRVDRKLVQRALENLIVNALRYSPPAGVVEVALRPARKGMAIDVSDRGPGVPGRLKDALFQKFGKAEMDAGGHHPGKSYGLGLYMVMLVAKAHGGEVSVRDRESGGTAFRLLLPLQALEDDAG